MSEGSLVLVSVPLWSFTIVHDRARRGQTYKQTRCIIYQASSWSSEDRFFARSLLPLTNPFLLLFAYIRCFFLFYLSFLDFCLMIFRARSRVASVGNYGINQTWFFATYLIGMKKIFCKKQIRILFLFFLFSFISFLFSHFLIFN